MIKICRNKYINNIPVRKVIRVELFKSYDASQDIMYSLSIDFETYAKFTTLQSRQFFTSFYSENFKFNPLRIFTRVTRGNFITWDTFCFLLEFIKRDFLVNQTLKGCSEIVHGCDQMMECKLKYNDENYYYGRPTWTLGCYQERLIEDLLIEDIEDNLDSTQLYFVE